MRKLSCKSGAGIALALLSPAVLAAGQEEALSTITEVMVYAFIVFVVVVIVGEYFMKSRDKREAPLSRIFEHGDAIHSVEPDCLVIDCVRLMTAERIGALMVMDKGLLQGIFTERDALNRVLAAGLDASRTKVSEVMTRDPCCVAPTISIGKAMEMITKRRFRHLPVVENGKLLAVVSSGDLTRWLVKDKLGEVRELAGVVAES